MNSSSIGFDQAAIATRAGLFYFVGLFKTTCGNPETEILTVGIERWRSHGSLFGEIVGIVVMILKA